MKFDFVLAAVFACAVTMVAPALAQPVSLGAPTLGYTYFNRPGADLIHHADELNACMGEAALVEAQDQLAARRNSPQGYGFLGNLFIDAMTQGTRPAAVENCMVVKGWRVVRVPDAEGAALSRLAPEQLAEHIAPWIGQVDPHGFVVRVWNNDAIRASTDRYELRPPVTPRGSLSVVSLGTATVPIEPQDERRIVLPRSVELGSLRTPSSGNALVVVRVVGISPRNGVGISFTRLGTNDAEADDGVRAFLAWGHGLTSRSGVWRAFEVRAGRWVMSGLHALSLCLGAPSFEAKDGEIIFAGEFDLSAEDIGPNLDLALARSWLRERQPTLAEAIRPAEYTNGWTSKCGGSSIYALEISGAPFREGYAWGSLANQD